MAEASQHTSQVLAKRHERLAVLAPQLSWPDNVWMGVPIENRRRHRRPERPHGRGRSSSSRRHPRSAPAQRDAEPLRPELEPEALLAGMGGHALEALREHLRVAVGASGRDLVAAGDGVPVASVHSTALRSDIARDYFDCVSAGPADGESEVARLRSCSRAQRIAV